VGTIQIIQGSNVSQTPFLDISNQVRVAGEGGLLGLAFSPGFATNKNFYVSYNAKSESNLLISRFSVSITNADFADPNTEQVILKIPTGSPLQHQAGKLAFGPDGFLYFGKGTLSVTTNNLNTLNGKITRIDVESGAVPYSVPTNNPFYSFGSNAALVWASGLRNPWRFSFDRLTGDLYIGDVGEGAYEEINFQPTGSPGGLDFGWPYREGPVAGPSMIPPDIDPASLVSPATWFANIGDSSAIGGYVYRGPPSRLTGIYVFADYGSARLFGLAREGSVWRQRLFVDVVGAVKITTFGEREDGSLVFAQGTPTRWRVWKLEDDLISHPPIFKTGGGTYSAPISLTVTSDTPNAIIYYTTDGTMPTNTSPVVPGDGQLWLASNTVLSAIATRADLTFSTVTQATYNFVVGTPTFSPPVGPITNTTTVLISSITPDATFRYTTDGTDPTPASSLYTGALNLNGNTELRARGYRDGFTESGVKSAFFSLALIPTLAQSNGVHTVVSWPASVGQAYQLQVSDDLASWTNEGLVTVATDSVMSLVDSNAAAVLPRRFYRLVLTNQ
jgi:glucose/arabinose dehydrogenase